MRTDSTIVDRRRARRYASVALEEAIAAQKRLQTVAPQADWSPDASAAA
jgi:hypothetical protein